mgnify:CR=1 FL=1
MAIGAKFVDVIPSSVENAIEVKKEDVKTYLFVGIPMSEFIGKKHEFEGYIFMCLQGVTGGVELGGDIAGSPRRRGGFLPFGGYQEV